MFLGSIIISALAGVTTTVAVQIFFDISVLEALMVYTATGVLMEFILLFLLHFNAMFDSLIGNSTSHKQLQFGSNSECERT